jgi:hypothetical protein
MEKRAAAISGAASVISLNTSCRQRAAGLNAAVCLRERSDIAIVTEIGSRNLRNAGSDKRPYSWPGE